MAVIQPSETMRPDIQVITDKDYQDICLFLSNFPDDTLTPEIWLSRIRKWWDSNPAYKPGHIRGVILRIDGVIAGFSGNVPTRMIWNGRETTVISGTTWRVLPEYRKYSMDIWLKHRELTADFIYFNTTPNSTVRKLLQALKFTRLPQPTYWYYFLGHPGSILRNPAVRSMGFLQKGCSYLASKILLARNGSVRVEPKTNTSVDLEIADLWDKFRSYYSFTNVRDKEYMQWLMKTQTILYVYSSEGLMGYVALHFDCGKETYILVDCWSPKVFPKMKQILALLISTYRHNNLIIPGFNSQVATAARSCWLPKRENPNEGYIWYGKEAPLDPERSFLTMLQGDYAL